VGSTHCPAPPRCADADSVGDTKVISQSLEALYDLVKEDVKTSATDEHG
jgi:hypothetical protein